MNSSTEKFLFEGAVIPAHPLALTRELELDEARQRRLTRYYLACGVGGLAVGVHTTQFSIRKPEINLLDSVLRLASEEIEKAQLNRPFIKIAGVCGNTSQAIEEATLAVKYDYDLGLVSLGGLNDWSEDQLIEHLKEISEIIPVCGFYLQPAVGGRLLSYTFWEKMVEIPGVMAIKIAAFNRYQTLDVIRAVSYSSRRDKIALYTGNDDNIVADLLSTYRFQIDGNIIETKFVGGLLGHFSVWTHKVVELFAEIKACIHSNYSELQEFYKKLITTLNEQVVIKKKKS